MAQTQENPNPWGFEQEHNGPTMKAILNQHPVNYIITHYKL